MKKEIKIFVVEDDYIFVNILCNFIDKIAKKLAEEDIKITYNNYYSSKEAAFELRKNPDILLLDYYIMNDEHEPDTAQSILKTIEKDHADLDVIIVSGIEDLSLINLLKKQGITEYIGKSPHDLMKLENLLTKIIRKKTQT